LTCSASGIVAGTCGFASSLCADCSNPDCIQTVNGIVNVTVHGEASATCCQPIADALITTNKSCLVFPPPPECDPQLPPKCDLSTTDAAVTLEQDTISDDGRPCVGDPCIIDDINSTMFDHQTKVTVFNITDDCCSKMRIWYKNGSNVEDAECGIPGLSSDKVCQITEFGPISAQEVVAGDAVALWSQRIYRNMRTAKVHKGDVVVANFLV
jgi:hypothetical protein